MVQWNQSMSCGTLFPNDFGKFWKLCAALWDMHRTHWCIKLKLRSPATNDPIIHCITQNCPNACDHGTLSHKNYHHLVDLVFHWTFCDIFWLRAERPEIKSHNYQSLHRCPWAYNLIFFMCDKKGWEVVKVSLIVISVLLNTIYSVMLNVCIFRLRLLFKIHKNVCLSAYMKYILSFSFSLFLLPPHTLSPLSFLHPPKTSDPH